MLDKNGNFLLLPVYDHKPTPLRKVGNEKLIALNIIAGWVNPHHDMPPSVKAEDPTIEVEEKSGGESPSFFLCLNGKTNTKTAFFVKGQIKHLSKDDYLSVANNRKVENQVLFRQYLLLGQGLESPEAMFIPGWLALEHTSMMED